MLGATAVLLAMQVPDHSALGDSARIAAALALACLVHRGIAHRLPQVELRFLLNAAAGCVAVMLSLSPIVPMAALAFCVAVPRLKHVARR
jgi:hypothetical protein